MSFRKRVFACPARLLLALLATLALSSLSPGLARTQEMEKAHLPKAPFKIFDGHLSADEKRCLAFALKQWVMYDDAPPADGTNPNEASTNVTDGGKGFNLDDAKDHARSSRSMSAGEKSAMKKVYGDKSPFHAPNQPVADPTAPNSPWFTNDEGAADVTIEPTDNISQAPGADGLCLFGTHTGQDPATTTVEQYKGKLSAFGTVFPATIYIRTTPLQGKTWCYPKDDNGDKYITNKDEHCKPGELDYYMIIKHELGHYFSFIHTGGPQFEPAEQQPTWDSPGSLCSSAMSPADDRGFAEDPGHEFASHAGRGYFASNRPGGLGGFDIWYVTWNDSLQRWQNPTNCGPQVNSSANEIDPSPAVGGSLLYLASDRPGGPGGYDLYLVRNDHSLGFDSLSALTPLNTPANETGPCETPSAMFFASDRPGGLGGSDLYRAVVDSLDNTAWGPATNLGTSVNTTANEVDPYVSSEDPSDQAMLLFSSNRPGGPGGYDIYAAQVNSGIVQPSFVVPPPVSSVMNETGPGLAMSRDAIYWATDLPSGHGGWDVFSARNITPRPRVLRNSDEQGPPGASVPIEFDVVNRGPLPIQVLPQLYNSLGWTLHWDPTVFQLQPGQLRRYPLTVDIPPSAPLGTSSRVFMTAVANFQVPAQDSSRVFSGGPVDVPPASGVGRVELSARPNPNAGEVWLTLGVPAAADARVEIYDLAGRRVRTLFSGRLAPGLHMMRWDGRDDDGRPASTGVRYCRAVVGSQRIGIPLIGLR